MVTGVLPSYRPYGPQLPNRENFNDSLKPFGAGSTEQEESSLGGGKPVFESLSLDTDSGEDIQDEQSVRDGIRDLQLKDVKKVNAKLLEYLPGNHSPIPQYHRVLPPLV